MDDADAAEKMRIRRERAAAWAAKRSVEAIPANTDHPSASFSTAVPDDESKGASLFQKATPSGGAQKGSSEGGVAALFPGWVKSNDVPTESSKGVGTAQRKRKGNLDDEDSSKSARQEEPVGWMAWAEQVSGPASGAAAGAVVTRGGGGGGGKEEGGYGWKHMVGGLETLAGSFGSHNSASLQQAEEERLLEEMDEDYRLPRDHRPQAYIDMSKCEMASMERPIPDSNKGFQMLLRMGWKGLGNGLGRNQSGIFDPIPLSSKDPLDLNSKVGVGRLEEENEMHEVATEKRKDLESEIQATETEERKRKREEAVEKSSAIKDEIKEIVSVFYCDICDKQYKTDEQFQEHLNSYDHHHKKRFMEFQREQKAMKGGPTAEERQKKEQRRMEKEMAARAAAVKAVQAPASSAPPPDKPPPALPESAGPVKFSLGRTPKPGAAPQKIGMAVGRGRGAGRPAPMAFGDEEDED